MRKVWYFLRDHVRQDFDKKQYGAIAIFLIASISLNYTFDFDDDYLEVMTGYPKFLAYLVFYSIPYFFSVGILAFFKNRMDIFFQSDFWIKSLFAIIVLSFDGSMPFLDPLVGQFFHPNTQYWAYKVALNSIGFLTVFLPILTFYILYEKKETNFYGLSARKFDSSPYFAMLLIMLPMIFAASFSQGFLIQYPMYKASGAHLHLGVPEWITVAGYELAYGMDFINVEYLFRGFLVIGMISILGRGAVLSMVVAYCFLHFGKPAAEAISSIFGGYILGVIAYETKSIWGGTIVHMGIAWMMELVAYVQKFLQ